MSTEIKFKEKLKLGWHYEILAADHMINWPGIEGYRFVGSEKQPVDIILTYGHENYKVEVKSDYKIGKMIMN